MRFAVARSLPLQLLLVGTVVLGAGCGLVGEAQAQSRIEQFINRLRGDTLPPGISYSNGRIEGQEIEISAKYSGRLMQLTVEEGDTVEEGQIVAKLDDREYRAQLLGAQAQVLRAEAAVTEADASILQRDSDRVVARSSYDRTVELVKKGTATKQMQDEREAQLKSAEAAYTAAQAARQQALAAIKAAEAEVSRLNAVLEDMVIMAPRRGRVQYKLAQTGEMIAAGARIMTLLDLTDVSMSIYLPASQVGTISIGDEARIVLDPAPDIVIPANVTFVSGDAQFTPKTVETQTEREKLVFRVKLRIPRELLEKYERQVKVGVRGLGFVRSDPTVAWPAKLAVNVPL
ncbi:HlyD family efflux transporter periplasmic adaptor subunit [Rhizobiaceae bacterium n13]|uniref:HlyD family efflux transporter periplasmic adaptor subunit n=1 Tax=Ferirhizobium litorale TaxID=2927786 RepID=A0AAE3U151_9HYPH|nr:HlyD family efflux transporter periplasmic adaptor subunit [Fererhizobium litorale]MDI7861949.1 HlyD family efflux transporter periplasmic adaptor subunit [Fererhizobium litorale]MDI7922779.1 HlyD family efflux transporter periplasmic adaptor subunit [Fererhizobium litorale]